MSDVLVKQDVEGVRRYEDQGDGTWAEVIYGGALGADADENTCTLTGFSWAGNKVPSCSAMHESGIDPVRLTPITPQPYGTRTTATTLQMTYPADGADALSQGHVISYLCVGQ